ncbi:MAG: hypothetical protein AB8G11_14155 [Saprospiraceae bacterium]
MIIILLLISSIISCKLEYTKDNTNGEMATKEIIVEDTIYKTVLLKEDFLYTDSFESDKIIKTYTESIEISVFQKKFLQKDRIDKIEVNNEKNWDDKPINNNSVTKEFIKGKCILTCDVNIYNNGIMFVQFPQKVI